MRSGIQALLGAGQIRAVQEDLETHQYSIALGRDAKAADIERQIRDLRGLGRRSGTRRFGARTTAYYRSTPNLSRAAAIGQKIDEAAHPCSTALPSRWRTAVGEAQRRRAAFAGVEQPDAGPSFVGLHVGGALRVGNALAVRSHGDFGNALHAHHVLHAERLRGFRCGACGGAGHCRKE